MKKVKLVELLAGMSEAEVKECIGFAKLLRGTGTGPIRRRRRAKKAVRRARKPKEATAGSGNGSEPTVKRRPGRPRRIIVPEAQAADA